jgi:disulfide bond formation protein DsbB
MTRRDAALAAVAAVSLAAVAAAWVSQHVYGMLPCPWCVLQRVIFVAIGASALLGLAWRGATGARVGAALGLAFAASGVAAAVWQNRVAAASASCDLTLADRIIAGLGLDERWPGLFMPLASCADAKVTMLGVPYEIYSLVLFVLLGATLAAVLRRPG